jgi:hypothetical protein
VNKALGVLIIGLGLIMIVIGVMGTQSQVLADIKNINPKLRQATGTPTTTAPSSNTGTGTNPASGGETIT